MSGSRSMAPRNSVNDYTDLMTRLGARRFAKIAFEEGDVLALRLPQRGARIIKRAYDAFRRANDAAGMFIVAARLAVISAAAGDREGLTHHLAYAARASPRRPRRLSALPRP